VVVLPGKVDTLDVVAPGPANDSSPAAAPTFVAPAPDSRLHLPVVPVGAGSCSCRLASRWTSVVPATVVVIDGVLAETLVPDAAPEALIGLVGCTPL
jgi:hypothetical protein